MPLPLLTLVLGGAASGKSAFAEHLVTAHGGARVYVATATAGDAEMRTRIDRHRAARGPGWRTVEAARDIAAALAGVTAADSVLLDCATLWLSNHTLANADITAETAALLATFAACPAPVVVVSNELGFGLVPADALSRRFRDDQGRLNQQIAAAAGLVVLVVAGLPLLLKGRLP